MPLYHKAIIDKVLHWELFCTKLLPPSKSKWVERSGETVGGYKLLPPSSWALDIIMSNISMANCSTHFRMYHPIDNSLDHLALTLTHTVNWGTLYKQVCFSFWWIRVLWGVRWIPVRFRSISKTPHRGWCITVPVYYANEYFCLLFSQINKLLWKLRITLPWSTGRRDPPIPSPNK